MINIIILLVVLFFKIGNLKEYFKFRSTKFKIIKV